MKEAREIIKMNIALTTAELILKIKCLPIVRHVKVAIREF